MARVWKEEEIRDLIQNNDKVLYRALKRIYEKQTYDEQNAGATLYHNGVGFNGADSKFMSGICEYLNKYGYLSDKQKYRARQRIIKYNKQLTRIANEVEQSKCMAKEV